MTKMATTPVNSKIPLKILSGTKGQMTLRLGMQHWGLDTDLFYGKVIFASFLCFYMGQYTFL